MVRVTLSQHNQLNEQILKVRGCGIQLTNALLSSGCTFVQRARPFQNGVVFVMEGDFVVVLIGDLRIQTFKAIPCNTREYID